MKRMTLIKLHLYFSGISLLFMCLMALSGSLHLLLGDESESVSVVKEVILENTLNKDELTNFFSQELSSIDAGYRYDYIKGSANSQMSRPTTRTYYTLKVAANMAIIEKHEPSILKRFMEYHKGHGARISRPILGILGLMVVAAVLTGLWLGWTSRPLRKITNITLLSGTVIYVIFLLL